MLTRNVTEDYAEGNGISRCSYGPETENHEEFCAPRQTRDASDGIRIVETTISKHCYVFFM